MAFRMHEAALDCERTRLRAVASERRRKHLLTRRQNMDVRHTRISDERRGGGSLARKTGWWTGIAGGGALTVIGLTRRSWPGIALAAAGGLMIAGGVRELRNQRPRGIHVERSFLVDRPVEAVSGFWRKFENLPRF